MEPQHKRLAEMLAAVGGSASTAIANSTNWVDPITRGIAFYGGAIVVILAGISWALDIRKKWKDRNK